MLEVAQKGLVKIAKKYENSNWVNDCPQTTKLARLTSIFVSLLHTISFPQQLIHLMIQNLSSWEF
jgi:hypothetical protein